jgi:hypothetical protein
MLIKKIIIVTTGICRINIHNQSFNSYLKFLDKVKDEIKIKWYINLDNPDYCKDNIDDTTENLKNILSNYDFKILHTEKPNFLSAVKNLIKHILPELTDDACLLWLEDDWVVNNDFNFKYIIDKLLLPYSLINLVFNLLGSFPPFIMGPELAKIYIKNFSINKRINNPEKLSRGILRQLSRENGIKYYAMFTNNHINYLNDQNFDFEKKIFYEETYLQIKDNNILVENDGKNLLKNNDSKDIQICTIKDYILINQNTNNIIFVRFGFAEMHLKYKHSYFKDIGREWKKNLIL